MLTEKPIGNPVTVYVSPNNYNDLYYLRREIDFFQFNCIRCNKLVTKKFWKKSHIEKYYIKFLCRSCVEAVNWANKTQEEKDVIFNKIKEKWKNKTHEEQIQLNNKTQKTKQERYGDPNYNNIEKVKQTNFKNLGVENVFQDKKIKEKSKLTKQKRYNNEFYNNSRQISATKLSYSKERKQEIRDKTIKTLNKKYGENINSVGDLNKINEIREKSKQTKQERYGDPNYNNSEQAAKTFENRYGKGICNLGDYAATEECRNKMKKTCLEKYDNPTYFGSKNHINYLTRYMQKNYRVDWYVQSNESKQYMLNKYGSEYYLTSKAFKNHMTEIGYPDNYNHEFLNYYGIMFDSSWELAVWIYYIDHNIKIIREPIKLTYLDIKGISHDYYPDFWINGIGYVEIKVDQFFGNNGNMIFPYNKPHHNSKPYNTEELKFWNNLYESKHQCGINNGVIFWTSKDIKPYIEYCINKYNDKKWYDIFKSNNYYNPSYWCLYYNNPIMYYVTRMMYNNSITPYNKIDNDGYIILDSNNKGITPYDIGRKR